MGKDLRLKLGKKIRFLRKKRRLTQKALADITDIDYKYIQRIEGKNPPAVRIDTIGRFAKALKVKPSELLDF
ncbi:MAG: helix-turn-helix domain-containing protein [Candidatus Omnitrophica bacterium]|nr:helix-turn-helix domain-containing protein [Candidatus Omnitrophota bacterium]